MIPKYAAIKQEYLGCPVHDNFGSPSIEVFETIEDYVKFIEENGFDYKIEDLIDLDTRNEVASNYRALRSHSIDYIDIHIFEPEERFRLIQSKITKKLKRE